MKKNETPKELGISLALIVCEWTESSPENLPFYEGTKLEQIEDSHIKQEVEIILLYINTFLVNKNIKDKEAKQEILSNMCTTYHSNKKQCINQEKGSNLDKLIKKRFENYNKANNSRNDFGGPLMNMSTEIQNNLYQEQASDMDENMIISHYFTEYYKEMLMITKKHFKKLLKNVQ